VQRNLHRMTSQINVHLAAALAADRRRRTR
jgi:hypothetical protein